MIHDTITAIQNQDLEIKIPAALKSLTQQLDTGWLLKSLT